jgi:hypothetical protein
MAIGNISDILNGVNRSSVIQALQKPGQTPALFKEVLKKLNTQLGLNLQTPAEVMAVKFLKNRFDKNKTLQTQYGSFENFLKSVDLQKVADKIESRLLAKISNAQLKTINFSQINFDSAELKDLSEELDQELELETNSPSLISQDMFLEPASSNDYRNHDWLQKAMLNIKESGKEVMEQIRRDRIDQDLAEEKQREKRLASFEVQKKEIAKAELSKDQELAVLHSKKMTSPVTFMTEKDLILGSFQSKKLQAGLQTA